jgi:hypothetical protein
MRYFLLTSAGRLQGEMFLVYGGDRNVNYVDRGSDGEHSDGNEFLDNLTAVNDVHLLSPNWSGDPICKTITLEGPFPRSSLNQNFLIESQGRFYLWHQVLRPMWVHLCFTAKRTGIHWVPWLRYRCVALFVMLVLVSAYGCGFLLTTRFWQKPCPFLLEAQGRSQLLGKGMCHPCFWY